MKRARTPDPTRWADRGADAHALEARAAALSEAAAAVQPLAPAALSRIRSEVAARRPRGRLSGVVAAGVRRRLAFGVGLLIACATTVGGARILWRKYVASPPGAAPASHEPPARQIPRRGPGPTALSVDRPAAPIATEAPAEAPEVQVDGLAPARPRRSAPAAIAPPPSASPSPELPAEPQPPPVEAPPPAPAPRVTETAMVAEALSNLRQRNDARAALAALDRYARAFPHGVLEIEALRTRVEADIKLGDRPAALALLDGRGAQTDALGPDLILTRAELRAAAGRFREAVADFTEVIEGGTHPLAKDGDERALYGRAVSLGRLGQHDRARVDLIAHQKRFPGGRFAAEVDRLLSGKGPSSGL